MYSVIIEAGNCVYCGRNIDDGNNVFPCEECRRKEEGIKCQCGKLKEDIAMVRPERYTKARRKLSDRGEQ